MGDWNILFVAAMICAAIAFVLAVVGWASLTG